MPTGPAWSVVVPEMVVLKGSSASCWRWVCCRCRAAGACARPWRRALTVLGDGDASRPLVGADDGTPGRPLVAPRFDGPAFFLAGTACVAGLLALVFLALAVWTLPFVALACLGLVFFALLFLALVFLALVFLGLVFCAALFRAGVFLAVLVLAVPLLGLALAVLAFLAVLVFAGLLLAGLALALLLLVGLALVGLVFALVVLAGRAVADPLGVTFFADARRFEGSAVFFAAVALPAAAFADATERPAMATALYPRSGAAAPLKAERPDRPRVARSGRE